MQIVVTGFQKFGNLLENPSEQLAKQFKNHYILETSGKCVDECLLWKENGERPILYVHLGVNAEAKEICIEKFGYNCARFNIPDVNGWTANGELIDEEEILDSALQCRVNVGNVVAMAKLKNRPVEVSEDPGRYVCNYLYYNSLRKTACSKNAFAVFVHIPLFTTMKMELQKQYLEELIEMMVVEILKVLPKDL